MIIEKENKSIGSLTCGAVFLKNNYYWVLGRQDETGSIRAMRLTDGYLDTFHSDDQYTCFYPYAKIVL
jgi:hypothetical protein